MSEKTGRTRTRHAVDASCLDAEVQEQIIMQMANFIIDYHTKGDQGAYLKYVSMASDYPDLGVVVMEKMKEFVAYAEGDVIDEA
jgi:hypothetical protein